MLPGGGGRGGRFQVFKPWMSAQTEQGGLGNLAREFGVIDRQFVRNELV